MKQSPCLTTGLLMETHGSSTKKVAERVRGRYGVSDERDDANSGLTKNEVVCVVSDVRVMVPNHDPILYVPSVEFIRSGRTAIRSTPSTTVDVDMHTANSIAAALEEAANGVKATMAAAKGGSNGDDEEEDADASESERHRAIAPRSRERAMDAGLVIG